MESNQWPNCFIRRAGWGQPRTCEKKAKKLKEVKAVSPHHGVASVTMEKPHLLGQHSGITEYQLTVHFGSQRNKGPNKVPVNL